MVLHSHCKAELFASINKLPELVIKYLLISCRTINTDVLVKILGEFAEITTK